MGRKVTEAKASSSSCLIKGTAYEPGLLIIAAADLAHRLRSCALGLCSVEPSTFLPHIPQS